MADYVNPFGGYAQGYGQGAQLEDELQQNARRARQADWENKYLNPDKAATSHLDLREGLAKEPYYNMALNDASRESRAGANNAQLDSATRFAEALRDVNPLNTAGRAADPFYANQPTQQLLRQADLSRNMALGNAAATQYRDYGMGDYYRGHNAATLGAAGLRSNNPAMYPAGPTSRGFPSAPAPAPAQNTAPAAPAAPSATNTLLDGGAPTDQGINPQASVTPFQELGPITQAHIIHFTSQLTGHPIDAVHAHIVNQLASTQPLTNQTNYATA